MFHQYHTLQNSFLWYSCATMTMYISITRLTCESMLTWGFQLIHKDTKAGYFQEMYVWVPNTRQYVQMWWCSHSVHDEIVYSCKTSCLIQMPITFCTKCSVLHLDSNTYMCIFCKDYVYYKALCWSKHNISEVIKYRITYLRCINQARQHNNTDMQLCHKDALHT